MHSGGVSQHSSGAEEERRICGETSELDLLALTCVSSIIGLADFTRFFTNLLQRHRVQEIRLDVIIVILLMCAGDPIDGVLGRESRDRL